jgi:endonuclease I
MKKVLILLPCLVCFLNSQGQIPAGYYNSANGLSGEPLKTALYNIINDHTVISYTALWNAFTTTDDNVSGNVWDMYSNCTFVFGTDQCGNYTNECDCYNREHSFPDSWFGGGSPMASDLFQLYPTDGKVNQIRSNYPFATVSSPSTTTGNGSKLGACSFPGYTGTVFEPIDMYKGDFARTYFYMATRYENQIASWQNNPGADAVLNGTSFPCYDNWFLQLLGAWHTADPVSQKEIDRNNEIYTSYQHNRNPFIDHPEYVYQVWGIGNPPATPEPTNFPSGFSAHNILLQWTDATGSSVPSGYLIRMSATGFDAIPVPMDGIPVANSADARNVAPGTQQALFSGLAPSTTYYFKIFSYTGSGALINYKTDGSVPQQQLTTSE